MTNTHGDISRASLERYSLHNKTALITGASGLLGRQHVSALLEVGASVIATDIDEAGLLQLQQEIYNSGYSSNLRIFNLDVANKSSVEKVYNELLVEKIRVDILINNAAIDPKVRRNLELMEPSRLENFTLEQWDKELTVGLRGVFLCCQIFGGSMATDKRGGVILNIASDLSVISPDQRLYIKSGTLPERQPVKPITYSVIKSGIIGITRYLATYWAEYGVRCNALSPGGVYNGQDDEFVQRLTKLIPMRRMASQDEYRSTIQYLCSDASSYMTGQNIILDGGRTVW
jgi:NAD(P)-dependent dehydrogenase (short-subunit alcohol dehydrogenase family)